MVGDKITLPGIHSKIRLAAGIMLRSLQLGRRPSHSLPDDEIVDPRIAGVPAGGRPQSHALDLTTDAMKALRAIDEDLSVRRAAITVARQIRNYWSVAWPRWAEYSDDLDQLDGARLARRRWDEYGDKLEQRERERLARRLERAYYHRLDREISQ